MKSQRGMFKWFGMLIAFAMIFEFVPALPSVSAQGENTPTPTAEPMVIDFNQDGLDDNQSSELSTTTSSTMLLNQQVSTFSIGMIETGEYEYPRDRLITLGYSVTLIPPTSGLSTFQQYDIVYLPVQWAEFGMGNYETNYQTIETHANDYHSYVYQGGGLFIDQPDPNYHPNSIDRLINN